MTVLKKKSVLITDLLSDVVSQLCQDFVKGWRPTGACSIWHAFFSVSNKIKVKKSQIFTFRDIDRCF